MPTAKQVYTFLRECPEQIGVTPYYQPFMRNYAGGWSGVQFIAESMVAIHQIDKRCWVDVFSCKEFDIPGAVQFVKESLKLAVVTYKALRRDIEGQEHSTHNESWSDGTYVITSTTSDLLYEEWIHD